MASNMGVKHKCDILIFENCSVLRAYAKSIKSKIRDQNDRSVGISITKNEKGLDNRDVSLKQIIGQLQLNGTVFGIIIKPIHQVNTSIDLHLLNGLTESQEHRNIPLFMGLHIIHLLASQLKTPIVVGRKIKEPPGYEKDIHSYITRKDKDLRNKLPAAAINDPKPENNEPAKKCQSHSRRRHAFPDCTTKRKSYRPWVEKEEHVDSTVNPPKIEDELTQNELKQIKITINNEKQDGFDDLSFLHKKFTITNSQISTSEKDTGEVEAKCSSESSKTVQLETESNCSYENISDESVDFSLGDCESISSVEEEYDNQKDETNAASQSGEGNLDTKNECEVANISPDDLRHKLRSRSKEVSTEVLDDVGGPSFFNPTYEEDAGDDSGDDECVREPRFLRFVSLREQEEREVRESNEPSSSGQSAIKKYLEENVDGMKILSPEEEEKEMEEREKLISRHERFKTKSTPVFERLGGSQ